MAFLVKKKTLIKIILVIIFILAIYLMFTENYSKKVFKKNSDTYNVKKVSEDIDEDDKKMNESINDVRIENKKNDFFIDYKLERDRLRSQEADYLRELINNPNATQQSKDKAQQELINLSQKVEKEMIVENLIKAKGFEDAVLFLSNDNANIVIKANKLSQKEVAQITDIVTKATGIPINKVTIIERN